MSNMKVCIVGAGNVGVACAKAMLLRRACHEIVLVDKNHVRSVGVATDLSHGEVLMGPTRIRAGDYKDAADSDIFVVTAGLKEGDLPEAIDKNDSQGRNRLVPANTKIYHDIIPKIAEVNPTAPIIIVTDPPDPLAEVARALTKTNPIISAGTYLDSIRFRLQIASRLGCHPSSVDANVLGEHGLSAVYVWSTATIGGQRVLDRVAAEGRDISEFKAEVQKAVKFANIDIINGTGASQHGIGMVTCRIVEAMLRDEGLVAPVGQYNAKYGTTVSVPSVIGRGGIKQVLDTTLTDEEEALLQASGREIAAQAAKVAGQCPIQSKL